MAEKCAGRKPSLSGYDSYPCHNPGKLQEEGLWWCGIHAPSACRARRAKAQAKWDEEAGRYRQQHAEERERDRRAALFPALVEALEAWMSIVDESEGVVGWHLNGAVAGWDEFDCYQDTQQLLRTVKGAESHD